MSQQPHVIARSGSFEVVSTGQVFTASNPVAAAARWAQANVAQSVSELVIGVHGKHGGFSIGDDPKKSATIALPSRAPLRAMAFIGLTDDAEIGSVQLWWVGGEPGPLRFERLLWRASNLSKFCLLASKQHNFTRCGVTLRQVTLAQWSSAMLKWISGASRKIARLLGIGDGPAKGGALWGIRGHGALLYVDVEDAQSDGFGEHGIAYLCNVQQLIRVVRTFCSDSGRTAIQITNREWEDAEKTLPTNLPSTPESATLLLMSNTCVDCGSYPGGKNGWTANGSAITVAGFPGKIRVSDSTITHTHPGGGGIVIYRDGKVGSFNTHDGYGNGDVELGSNRLNLKSGATAGREAVMIGSCRSLLSRANVIAGTERRVKLGHSGPIGHVDDDGSLAA